MRTHLIIPDSHAKPGVSNNRFSLLGKFIVDKQPDAIINIGDMADMESLCVAPDTKVLTSTLQWVEAGALQIDDEILGFTEKNVDNKATCFRKFETGKVTNNRRFIAPKGYKITTTHGEVVCSHDHKFLSYNIKGAKKDFRDCSKLKIGRRIVSLSSNWKVWDYALTDKEIGYLQGFFDGEAYYGDGRLSWSQNNGPVADYVLELVRRLGVNVEFYCEEGRPKLKHYYIQGSYLDSWKVLHLIRPMRLLSKLLVDVDGKTCSKFSGAEDAEILSITPLEDVEVIGLETDLGTYISNNLFSHNCSYDKGTKSFEGRRYLKDIASVVDAQQAMFNPIYAYNGRQTRKKKALYKPELYMCLGNHENRINRVTELQPELDGTLSVDDLQYDYYGWETTPFLDVLELDGIHYSHYHASGVLSKAISGEHPAHTLLRKQYVSCTMGHSHTLDYKSQVNANGRRIHGLVCGCFLEVDQIESYAGPANKLWWRGLILKHIKAPGDYDIEFISIERLEEDYG